MSWAAGGVFRGKLLSGGHFGGGLWGRVLCRRRRVQAGAGRSVRLVTVFAPPRLDLRRESLALQEPRALKHDGPRAGQVTRYTQPTARMPGFLASALARHRVQRNLRKLRGRGIEIGAHDLPIAGIRPLYVDRAMTFAGGRTAAGVLADAAQLPFAESALDYLAHSHVLEHLPNPVRALVEWYRVVRPGGWIYMVVPDRRYTFDRPRECTPVAHMLRDYEDGTDVRDATHFEDYAMNREMEGSHLAAGRDRAEWPALRMQLLAEMREDAARGGIPGLHYHVFEPPNLVELLETLQTHPATRLDWRIARVEEGYPPGRGDGILALLRVRKRRRG
jgi:SAM-dependent methyltransferase